VNAQILNNGITREYGETFRCRFEKCLHDPSLQFLVCLLPSRKRKTSFAGTFVASQQRSG
jgi:hypothetical protein